MINLNRARAVRPAVKLDPLSGIRILQYTIRDQTQRVSAEDNFNQVSAQNLIAGIAAVPIRISPSEAKLLAFIGIFWRPSFDRQRL